MHDTPIDLRTLADRPAPVAALPDPWQDISITSDPVRAAALARARRAVDDLAALTLGRVADMLRRALPGAGDALIERTYRASCTCHTMILRLVRDEAGAVLWRDDDFDDHPDVVRRAELEAYGAPVLPVLAPATRDAIEALLADAIEPWGNPLPLADEPFVVEDGDLCRLRVGEAIAEAARVAAASVSVGLDVVAEVLARETSVVDPDDVDALLAALGAAAAASPHPPSHGVTTGDPGAVSTA